MINYFLKDKKNCIILILVALCAFLMFFKPNNNSNLFFINEDNAEKNLPKYTMRKTKRTDYNGGVCIEIVNNKKQEGNIIFVENSDTIMIQGWAVDLDRMCNASEIYFKAGNRYVKGFYGIPRSDIGDSLRVRCSYNIGFIFYFDKKLIEDREKIKFYLVDKEKKMVIESSEYYLSVSKKQKRRDIKSLNWNKGLMIENVNGQDRDMQNNIIKVGETDKVVISGWAYDADNNTKLKGISAIIGNKYISANYGIERELVANVIGISDKELGFVFEIDKNLLLDKNGKLYEYIDFEFTDANGVLCNPLRYKLEK